MGPKRSASAMQDAAAEDTDGKKKQKAGGPGSRFVSRLQNMTDDERKKWREDYERLEAQIKSMPPRNERQEINDELEAGSHHLALEHNNTTSAKCRADKCLVKEHPHGYDDKIRSPYRLNLYAAQPDRAHWSQLEKPNRRFFHVSCLESIGVNIAQYMTLPPEEIASRISVNCLSEASEYFHPAVVDWVKNKGKAFDANLYDEYENALKSYREKVSFLSMQHAFSCSKDKCTCGLPLDRPKSDDFITGEREERTLTDVLLCDMGADHLLSLEPQNKMKLLELWGRVPPTLEKAALAAARDAESDSEEEETEGRNDDSEKDEGAKDESEKGEGHIDDEEKDERVEIEASRTT